MGRKETLLVGHISKENIMQITYTKETTIPVSEIGSRLEAAAKKQKFGVLNETDLRGKMQSKGVDFKPQCMIFDVCNPNYAKMVLDSNIDISTALPCRISVYEDNGLTKVSTLLPTKVLNMFGTDGLDTIAQSVEKALVAIIDEVTSTE